LLDLGEKTWLHNLSIPGDPTGSEPGCAES